MIESLDSYSRFVFITKYALAGLAGLIFVSLFFISEPDEVRNNNLIGNADLAKVAVGQAIQNPQFSGLTDEGDTIMVRAESAAPDAPRPTALELAKPSFELDTRQGNLFMAEADSGFLKLGRQVAQMSGNVQFTTDQGYQITAQDISVNLRKGEATGLGDVRVSGPMGQIEANKVTIRKKEGRSNANASIIEFSGGVSLQFQPEG